MSKQNGNGRTFEDKPATRERVPLWVAASGCSGSGKTFSALRLATGIQRVTGGDVFYIDSEARRALHYADRFKFRHVEFSAPFGPLDYLAAIEHCVKQGGRTIVIDSASHEHEGPGGVLEMHESEMQRLSGGDYKKAERVKMLAWSKPKQERRRLINAMLQMQCNFILCFRAKEKLKIEKGKEPEPLGWMPIAGDEWVYECTVHAMLPPGSGGVPQWRPTRPGEQAMVKLPVQFHQLFAERRPLDEATGEAMAKWAAGAAPANGHTTAPNGPRFGSKTRWAGAAEWAGKPLAGAPVEALRAYYDALENTSHDGLSDRASAALTKHIEEVDTAWRAASTAAEEQAENAWRETEAAEAEADAMAAASDE